MELTHINNNDAYFDLPAKIGLVRVGDGKAVAIDSGNDKDAGKKLVRACEGEGLTLTAIYNTHSHADHVGGNALACDRTGCRVFAPGIERAFTCHPILEPATLWGGFPPEELRHKFLLAAPSPAEPLTEDLLPEGMRALPLPGHSFDMTGYLTKDGTAFIADTVSSEETLRKYGIGYLWDVEASLATLAALPDIPAKVFVPSHAPATEDIRPLAEANARAIREACERITALCLSVGFDDLLAAVFASYGLPVNPVQYALVGSTVRSYLAYLGKTGAVSAGFDGNKQIFVKN